VAQWTNVLRPAAESDIPKESSVKGGSLASSRHHPLHGSNSGSPWCGTRLRSHVSYFSHFGAQTFCALPTNLRVISCDRGRCLPHRKHDMVAVCAYWLVSPNGDPDTLAVYLRPSCTICDFFAGVLIALLPMARTYSVSWSWVGAPSVIAGAFLHSSIFLKTRSQPTHLYSPEGFMVPLSSRLITGL